MDLALQFAWYAKEAGERIAERYLEAFRRATRALLLTPGAGVWYNKFREALRQGPAGK